MEFLKRLMLLINLGVLLLSTPVLAEEMKIITPYLGIEENIYRDDQYGLNLKDSQIMKGLYYQAINPEKYQWNLFVYNTTDINYSDLTGLNFIYDHYFGADNNGKNVIGIGANYLQMDLAGDYIPTKFGTLDGLEMEQDILSIYTRIGRYYNYNQDKVRFSILPWVGGQLDQTNGSVLVDLPGPGAMAFKINEDQYSWIAGVNFKLNYHHFLQLEAKHTMTYNEDFFRKSTAMVNFSLTRKVGLSYRYNNQETSVGEDSYNIFGVSMVF